MWKQTGTVPSRLGDNEELRGLLNAGHQRNRPAWRISGQGGQVFRRRDELVISHFQFVDDHRDTYEVKRLCQVLDVNRSSYYKWLAGAQARVARRHQDRILTQGSARSTASPAAPTAPPA
ncbi:hypothetical protein [Streptomyces sp. NPDC058307]|uniref:hypothetical protein n=1 Tax=Streptomyces sp. NPDC058307 TaxID=3346439 RepID=UPI0036E62F9E